MEVAHDSIMSGHLGVKKTLDRIQSSFYWTGIRNDVKRFCRSCDACQKTVDRGKARRVPLQQMPVIETPFKRVAVDLIGPIHLPSKEGHIYVLTLVDYATRYPEAQPQISRLAAQTQAQLSPVPDISAQQTRRRSNSPKVRIGAEKK